MGNQMAKSGSPNSPEEKFTVEDRIDGENQPDSKDTLVPEACAEENEGTASLKRKQDNLDVEDGPKLRPEVSAVVQTESIKEPLQVVIQAGQYFPFSKRCVKVQNFGQLPPLAGKLKHGGFMFQIAKRDFKEEFELLPRCGQKICNEVQTDEANTKRRLGRIYQRFREAFDAPRYLEIFQAELEPDLVIKRSAELELPTGNAVAASLALGSFARFFGRSFDDSFNRRLLLSPYESFFMADAGAMQLTLSQAPIGVEDSRAIMETLVPDFVSRYAVFSELQRTTRYALRTYDVQYQLRSGQWDFSAEHLHEAEPERHEESPGMKEMSGLLIADAVESHEIQRGHGPGRQSGFATSMLGKTEEARRSLAIPEDEITGQEAAKTTVTDRAPHSAVVGTPQPDYPQELRKEDGGICGSRLADTTGIDIAFYGCEKAMYWTPPAFDVAITQFRDKKIPVSAVFAVFRAKKNPGIPVLMERFGHGQLSGYGLQLARVPTVEYSGRKDTGIAEGKDHYLKKLLENKRKLEEESCVDESKGDSQDENTSRLNPAWVPPVIRRRQLLAASGST